MRRTLLVAAAVGVLVAAAAIPIAVFAAPGARVPRATAPDADGLIPWQLSGAAWNECPMRFPPPEGLAFGVGTDAQGQWYVVLYDDQGGETPEDELGVAFPQLVEPVRTFRECLNRFPTEPYREPRTLSPVQREMYWAYVVTELAPCLRGHDRAVELPGKRIFATYDYSQWYIEQADFWDGYAALDEQLTIWNECPMLPSYLE